MSAPADAAPPDAGVRDVTVVTVAYRSDAVLPAMLDSVPAGVPVVVVDNDPASPTPVPTDRLGLRTVRNAANLGFGAACNRGAALADTPLVLFLNPDARLRGGAIEALLAAAARHPDAVAFNPIILDRRGRPHVKRRSVLVPRGRWLPRAVAGRAVEAPVLSGAAFLVRRAAFERVGGFDEAIFLYHEDDDLSLRLGHLGTLRLVPDAVVDHAEGRSTVRDAATAAWKGLHQGRSRVYAVRKHRVPFGVARALGGAVLGLLGALALSRRKRAKAAAYLRGVLDAAARSRPSGPT